MQAIHKIVLEITDSQTFTIDNFFQVISCQIQNDKLCVWYIVDDHNGRDQVLSFQVIGTGNPFEIGNSYLATVQQNQFVWHVFYNFVITQK